MAQGLYSPADPCTKPKTGDRKGARFGSIPPQVLRVSQAALRGELRLKFPSSLTQSSPHCSQLQWPAAPVREDAGRGKGDPSVLAETSGVGSRCRVKAAHPSLGSHPYTMGFWRPLQ